MLNILWSVLNVLLLLGMGYILFQAARLVQQHMGWGRALLFIFALLAMSGRRAAAPGGPAKNLLDKAPAHGPLANASASQTIDLGGTNHLFLRAEYNAHGDTLAPRGLYAGVSGFMLGHEWEPNLGMLQQEGPQLHYWTVLNHRWLLLGTPVFANDGVVFEGTMKPDRPLALH